MFKPNNNASYHMMTDRKKVLRIEGVLIFPSFTREQNNLFPLSIHLCLCSGIPSGPFAGWVWRTQPEGCPGLGQVLLILSPAGVLGTNPHSLLLPSSFLHPTSSRPSWRASPMWLRAVNLILNFRPKRWPQQQHPAPEEAQGLMH